MGAKAEVPDSLAGVLGSAEQQGVAASGRAEGKLVESDGLTTGSSNAGASRRGETKSGNGDLGNLEQAVVIRDGTNDDDGALFILLGVGRNAGDGDGRAVDTGHEEATEDDLVEVAVTMVRENRWPSASRDNHLRDQPVRTP